MILLIAGGTHTGKTLAAQKLLEDFHVPYLSIDHVKMGLIRSGICPLTPESDDEELTSYLWNVVREIIKTAIENKQHLIIEGCYIPFSWKHDFTAVELENIKSVHLIFDETYIRTSYDDIVVWEHAIEQRKEALCSIEELLVENRENLAHCIECECDYILVENRYDIDLDLERCGVACFGNGR